MALRQILLLSNSHLRVYIAQGGRVHDIGDFAATDAGLALFDDYLQQAGPLPSRVLVDLVEEDFRRERVTHTVGGDRRALLQRHTQRLYRNTAYRHAELLGPAVDDRRRDEVLFSGIINPDSLEKWLQLLHHHRVPVAGIHSLPLLGGGLLKQAWQRREDVLLVTHNRDSGLRQSYFRGGRLHFSRLSPLAVDPGSADYIVRVHDEIGKTKRYLANLKLLARDQLLDVCLLTSAAVLAQARDHCARQQLAHYHLVDTVGVAGRLRLDEGYTSPYCDPLYAQLLVRKRPTNHYARPADRRHHRLHLQRRALQAASLVVAVGGLLWSSANLLQGALLEDRIAASRQLRDAVRSRYEAALAQVPHTPVAPRAIHAAVQLADTLDRRRQLPDRLLALLGAGLQQHPALQLEDIEWYTGASPDTAPPGGGPEHADTTSADSDAGAAYQIVEIGGHMEPFSGNYLRAHRRLADFLADLRRQPGIVRAEAVKLPLDMDPASRVSGSTGDGGGQQRAPFRLRVVMEVAHETS